MLFHVADGPFFEFFISFLLNDWNVLRKILSQEPYCFGTRFFNRSTYIATKWALAPLRARAHPFFKLAEPRCRFSFVGQEFVGHSLPNVYRYCSLTFKNCTNLSTHPSDISNCVPFLFAVPAWSDGLPSWHQAGEPARDWPIAHEIAQVGGFWPGRDCTGAPLHRVRYAHLCGAGDSSRDWLRG